MKRIENIIVFDTEFISAPKGSQPFQVAMIAFNLRKNKLERISSFSIFITLRSGVYLNHYVKEYTGISEETLNKEGIYPEMAKKQAIEYLLSFDIDKTILLGWDPSNDYRMFNNLFNYSEELIDLSAFRWFDLAASYKMMNKITDHNVPSLKSACKTYNIADFASHDAMNDCEATVRLLEAMLETYGDKCLYDVNEVKYSLIKKRRYRKERTKGDVSNEKH